jgi:uncharacterized protein
VVRWTWRVKLARTWKRNCSPTAQQAEEEAIRVFGQNLNDLLLAAPPARAPRWASTPACAPA